MTEHDAHRELVSVLNQLYEIDRKSARITEAAPIRRHVERIRESLRNLGWAYEDPTNSRYSETRTDCEADLTGKTSGELVVLETIKPIIRTWTADGETHIVQRAVVLVGSPTEDEANV